MVALKNDSELEVTERTFDPLRTPYEVDELTFPAEGSLAEQYTHLLRYAILAPSSYNTQPWKFRLFDNGIAVYADYTRRLPVADPNSRELLMGVGAAIMNLRIAAAHFGFDCRVDYNYSGDSELPIAFASVERSLSHKTPDDSVEKLFSAIAKRHTNRNPFLMARVPEAVISRLSNLGGDADASLFFSTDATKNTTVAHLVAAAERVQQGDTQFRKELAEWIRPNKTHKSDGMTGAAFGVSDVTSTLASWAIKTIDMSNLRARHDERLCLEAPALLVLYGEDSVPTWLAVGEVMEKILLTLTRDGLQFSFFNMPIELPEARLELRKLIGVKSWPQLLLRIGYSLEKPAPSPRRPVEECIVK
ncbi:MAG: nitroreductase family protein [Ignavibacteriae bacterium]|nr:nitroreductase family protein [Ignavibacteriota bacterium]